VCLILPPVGPVHAIETLAAAIEIVTIQLLGIDIGGY
jgi:hypothetical protein